MLRFVRLNLYFFVMYSLLTMLWYAVSGNLAGRGFIEVLQEVSLNGAVFALLFSLAILIWYRRGSRRVPVQQVTLAQLQQRLQEAGYVKVEGQTLEQVQVYKPAPPRAPALAGKVFVQRTTNFYVLQGPIKYIKKVLV